MERVFAFFVIALVANGVVGRPQSNDDELEDKYGPIFVNPGGNFQGQGFPGQGFPGQGFPGQGFPGQGFPGQGFPGQGFPGQGFPGQGFPGQGFPQQGNRPGQGFPQQGNRPGQGFPQQGNRPGQFPGQQQQQQQPLPTSTATPNNSNVEACIQSCPVTSEYNPVCGTNNVQYGNPGRLQCAQDCGVNVSLLRASPCPATTPAPAPSR